MREPDDGGAAPSLVERLDNFPCLVRLLGQLAAGQVPKVRAWFVFIRVGPRLFDPLLLHPQVGIPHVEPIDGKKHAPIVPDWQAARCGRPLGIAI